MEHLYSLLVTKTNILGSQNFVIVSEFDTKIIRITKDCFSDSNGNRTYV
jgi:hypothetical protein